MFLLFGIYAIVGGVSAVTNFGKWLFSSPLIGYFFLPFMIIYYLIYGDSKQKKEAITILKGLTIAAIISVLIISIFKGWIICAFFTLIALGLFGFIMRLVKKQNN